MVALWPEADYVPHGSGSFWSWVLPALPLDKGKSAQPSLSTVPKDNDDAEHTLFVCMFWSGERKAFEQSLGRPAHPEDVVGVLFRLAPTELPEDQPTRRRLVSAVNRWRELFTQMVEEIMGRKEELERERQRAGDHGAQRLNITN